MKIGSLFSGYGGLDIAVENHFDAETVWHAEFEEAPSKALAAQQHSSITSSCARSARSSGIPTANQSPKEAPMYDLRRPCEADYQCEHKICWACEKTLRSDKQRKDEHPGTVPGHIFNRLCDRCKIEGHPSIHDLPQPEPEPESEVLPDERHILLSDEEMLHIMFEHPTAFTWHAERRKRLKLGEYS